MDIPKLFDLIPSERKRKPIPEHIVQKALRQVDKIKQIPYKQARYSKLFWRHNPYVDDCLRIDLPILRVETLRPVKDVRNNVIFYDPKKFRHEKMRVIKDSCVVVHGDEIVMVYVNSKTDAAILKACERLEALGKQMEKYYPVKNHTFYSGLFDKPSLEWRYYGKNWMDGMIRYLHKGYGKNLFTYQPRSPQAYDDPDFLYNLVYSYCALYELEKRYAPAIARYRYDKAKNVNFPKVFPNVPLEYHCATSCGASVDFASALHGDSGVVGITETIFWTKPKRGGLQYFVSPSLGLVFDLTEHNAIILQPPNIPHGTVHTKNHGGYGFVNITKANAIAQTPFTSAWYDKWNSYLSSAQAQRDFA